MKSLIASVAVLSTLGMLSVAQADTRLLLDDETNAMVPAPAQAGFTVDIDDDGWTRIPLDARSDRGAPASGECTQLELSLGVTDAACGTIALNELVRMKFDSDSND